MFVLLRLCFGLLVRLFHSRASLLIENLALRQQLAEFKRKHSRPKLAAMDKLFWVAARRFWSSWKEALIVVTPDTVVRWHRAGFQFYWRLLSRAGKRLGGDPSAECLDRATTA
jgi:predicted amidophosphoribosyltransferase